MPALLRPIASTVEPRMRVWSRAGRHQIVSLHRLQKQKAEIKKELTNRAYDAQRCIKHVCCVIFASAANLYTSFFQGINNESQLSTDLLQWLEHTSNTTASQFVCLKWSAAIRNVSSNSVAGILCSAQAPRRVCKLFTKDSSGSSSELTWILSRKLAKWGLTKSPVRTPFAFSTSDSLKEVVPCVIVPRCETNRMLGKYNYRWLCTFPFVPPTCKVGIESKGLPIISYNRFVLANDISWGAEMPSFRNPELIA